MWELRRNGPASRSALAMQLGVSNASLTKLSRELLALGLVEEGEEQGGRARGRPAMPLRISAQGGYAVGATVHRGFLEVALVDYAGSLIATANEPFESPDPRVFADNVLRILKQLAVENGLLSRRLLGVGIGVPGPALDSQGGRRWTVAGFEGWRDKPLDEIIGDNLGLPVWLENDANAAALGEYYAGGLIRRYASAVVILVGHGIGAGVIVDGKLLRGEIGNAGDIGRLYPIDQPRPSSLDLLATLAADGCKIDSLADFERKTAGHKAVIAAWAERAARQLELVVDGSVVWFDPGAIVLSGPLPLGLLQMLQAHLGESWLLQPKVPVKPPALLASTIGSAAVSIGAALLPIHAHTTAN